LIFDTVEAEMPIFSVGTSIPDLAVGLYTFALTDTGLVDRAFRDVRADGDIYRYELLDRCEQVPVPDTILLIQLTSDTDLRAEIQRPGDGPPWAFTAGAVDFVR
jgi:hypothetical protein